MTGEAVSNYIDHFDTAFGARTKVKVVARPVKGSQKLQVADRDTIVTFNVDVNIKNPFASEQREMDAVRASVEVTASVRINIRPDYKITGKVKDLKTKILSFKTFFKTYSTQESLTT